MSAVQRVDRPNRNPSREAAHSLHSNIAAKLASLCGHSESKYSSEHVNVQMALIIGTDHRQKVVRNIGCKWTQFEAILYPGGSTVFYCNDFAVENFVNHRRCPNM